MPNEEEGDFLNSTYFFFINLRVKKIRVSFAVEFIFPGRTHIPRYRLVKT